MSSAYRGYDYENDWLALGCMVWFDGPSATCIKTECRAPATPPKKGRANDHKAQMDEG